MMGNSLFKENGLGGGKQGRIGRPKAPEVENDKGQHRQAPADQQPPGAPGVPVFGPGRPGDARHQRGGAEEVGGMHGLRRHREHHRRRKTPARGQGDGQNQQDTKHTRLPDWAEDVLAGQAACPEFRCPGIAKALRQEVELHGMQQHQARHDGGPARPAAGRRGGLDQQPQGGAEGQEHPGIGHMQSRRRNPHQGRGNCGEQRKGIDRPGKPVRRQRGSLHPRDGMQQIGVLVAGVQRQLAVGQGEDPAPPQRLQETSPPARNGA